MGLYSLSVCLAILACLDFLALPRFCCLIRFGLISRGEVRANAEIDAKISASTVLGDSDNKEPVEGLLASISPWKADQKGFGPLHRLEAFFAKPKQYFYDRRSALVVGCIS